MIKKAQGLLFDIVNDIAAAGLRAGDRLPAQAEMARRYGVGVTPLREALRMLELSGVISLQPGRAGGVVADQADAEQLAALVAAVLCVRRITYGQLLDACVMTEPLLAAAAATHPQRDAVRAELEPFLSERDDDRAAPVHDSDFREAIARAADNPALSLVAQVLSQVADGMGVPAGRRDMAACRVKRAVIEAILSGDADLAREHMAAHLGRSLAVHLERIGRGCDEIFVPSFPPRGRTLHRGRRNPGPELPRTLAP
jgi:GntR family transcriptional repressor for pyruvate dehydrogenase complex